MKISLKINDKEGEQTVEPVTWNQLCMGLPDLQPQTPTKKCMKQSGCVGPTVHVLGQVITGFFSFSKAKETRNVQNEVI